MHCYVASSVEFCVVSVRPMAVQTTFCSEHTGGELPAQTGGALLAGTLLDVGRLENGIMCHPCVASSLLPLLRMELVQ